MRIERRGAAAIAGVNGRDAAADKGNSGGDDASFIDESELRNIRSFNVGIFIDDLVAQTENCVDEEGNLCRKRLATRLIHHLNSNYPELGAMELLQKIEHAVPEAPVVSFKESGMKYDKYLRAHFSRSIRDGFLPIGQIADKALRRRVSVEKSRKNFPTDLTAICLTQNEVAQLRRQTVGVIIGLGEMAGNRLAQFARSLISFEHR